MTRLEVGDTFATPLDNRCFFAGGSVGVAGDGGPDRCMNFMPANREDITLFGLAMLLINVGVMEFTRKHSRIGHEGMHPKLNTYHSLVREPQALTHVLGFLIFLFSLSILRCI